MAAKKKAPVPDRDWESEYRRLVSGMLKERSARLTDWLVDTVGILSEALSVTGAVKTSYGCVKRTPKGGVTIGKNDPRMLDGLEYSQIAEIAEEVSNAIHPASGGKD